MQLLDATVEDTLTWTPDSIMVDVATSFTDDTTTTIDLVPTLGHKTKIKGLPKSPDDVYWLPGYYNANNAMYREHYIAPKFIAACKIAGFSLAMKGWDKSKGKDVTQGWGWIILRCTRGRHHIEPKDPEQDEETVEEGPTTAPTKLKKFRAQRPLKGEEDTCKCQFKVFFDPTSNRWYLPKRQGGNASHLGHPRKDPELVRVRATAVGVQATEDAIMQLKEHINSNQVSGYIDQKTGMTLEYHQIRHINKKRLQKQMLINLEKIDGNVPEGELSCAEKLINNLTANPKYSFVVLYGQYHDNRLTICQRSKKASSPATQEVIENDTLDDGQESPATQSDKIRKALHIQGSGQILLGCAWTNEAAQRRLEMFPEFIAADVTKGTNAEKRPLLLACGKDSSNHTFTSTWFFLPSEGRWVFDWAFGQAMPALHQQQTLARNRLFITDEDRQEYEAFTNLSIAVDGGPYPNSVHRLCAFHKNMRNCSQHTEFVGLIAELRNHDTEGWIEWKVHEKWLWNLCRYVETHEEAELSSRLFKEYMEEDEESLHRGELGESLRARFKKFLSKSFFSQSVKLLAHHYHTVFGHEMTTSNPSESENSSLKTSTGGPKPQDSIDVAQDKIDKLHHRRIGRQDRQTAVDLSSTMANKDIRNSSVVGVTVHCSTKLQRQYEESENYLVYQQTSGLFYVKRQGYDDTDYSTMPLEHIRQTEDERIKHRANWIIPRFERTRTVTVDRTGDNVVIACSCHMYTRNQICCRHIYSLLTRRPCVTDAGVRWWNVYSAYYGRRGQIDNHLKSLLASQPNGVPVKVGDLRVIDNTSIQVPFAYFSRSLNRVKMVEANYWTAKEQGLYADGSQRPPEDPYRGYGVAATIPVAPVGTTMEVHLSQTTQEAFSQSWLSQLSQTQDIAGDSDTAGGSEDVEPTSSPFEENEPFVDNSAKEEWAYTKAMSLYKQITDTVETKDDLNVLIDGLNHLHVKVMARCAKRKGLQPAQGQSGRFSDWTQADTRKKGKRKTPACSPSRRKGRKRKRNNHRGQLHTLKELTGNQL